MAVVIPNVVNWSVTPQNGQEDYFTKMNIWLSESTNVIASLSTAITKINESNTESNDNLEEVLIARDQTIIARNEAVTAVATLTAGAIDNTTIASNKAFSNQYIENNYYDKTSIDTAIIDNKIDRIGLIDYGYVAKPYHIIAFGGEFNRADYPLLWAWLQGSSFLKTEAQWQAEATANSGICGFYSSGNGTTTFRVPNSDEAFLRPDSRGVGTYQGDAIRNIQGSISVTSGVSPCTVSSVQSGVFKKGTVNRGSMLASMAGASYDLIIDASLNIPTADENRPKNIAILPLIVAK